MEDMMMKGEELSLSTLITNELIQGKELAKQLCHHMVSSSSHETNEFLIEKILSTYEKALTILNCDSSSNPRGANFSNGNMMMNSHCSSTNGSPRSEVVDEQDFDHKPPFKKRKTVPRWTEKVKICSKTGLEGSLDDGHSWRKYGQKDILGSKFPRAYYRCTHRNVQGCLATKQVQKSDADPTTIEVNYKGRHTCIQSKHLNKKFPSKPKMDLSENHHQQQHKVENKIEQPQEAFFKFETEDLDTNNTIKEDIFPWFCYLSPSMGSENGNDDDNNNNDILLSETMVDNNLLGTFSQAFISPESSESDLFCWSSLSSTGLVHNVQTSESGNIAEIVSATNSVTNSPILDLDVLLDKGDFDANFPFNTSEYFTS